MFQIERTQLTLLFQFVTTLLGLPASQLEQTEGQTDGRMNGWMGKSFYRLAAFSRGQSSNKP
jgi:hypothetical protein